MTVIYYSSNRENPQFEEKIMENLYTKVSGLPIISVTQKPVALGQNICVGDVGTSGFNVCRQIQIGCEAAATPFVITAEADCLYSPDYFTFIPPKWDVCYRNTNIYVQKYQNDFCNKKNGSLFSTIVGRRYFLNRLDELFGDAPKWNSTLKNWPKEIGKKLFDSYGYFETLFPCISFKTGNGLRKHSPTGGTPYYELPYWGSIKTLRENYE